MDRSTLRQGSINRGEKKKGLAAGFPRNPGKPAWHLKTWKWVCVQVGMHAYVDLELCPCPSMPMPRGKGSERGAQPPCWAAFRPQLRAQAQPRAQTFVRAHGDKLPFLRGQR